MNKAEIAKAAFEANPEVNALVVFECGNVFDATKKSAIASFRAINKIKEEGELFERNASESEPKKSKK